MRRDWGRDLEAKLCHNFDLEVVTPWRYRNEGAVMGLGTHKDKPCVRR